MIALRPYQQAAVDAIYDWFGTSTGNPLVVVPTGGGKSLILAAFIRSVLEKWPGEKILCLTHVRELIEQNHNQMLRWWPEAPAGIYSAGLRKREIGNPITFAGIQSIYKRANLLQWVDLILIDEAHLLSRKGESMYQRLINDLRSVNSNLKLIGLTATPFRTGEGRLDTGKGRMFHGIAYNCDLADLIRDGYLSRIRAKHPDGAIDTQGVRVRAGEFVEGDLERAAMAGNNVAHSCAEIVRRASGRKAWLVFCCGIAHAKAVAKCLAEEHGKRAATVFGTTPSDEREHVLTAYKAGELDVIVNVNVLTTGFDAPHTDLIALLRPTMSPVLYVQMTGRGLRIAPGKNDCLVLDFGGNFERHGPLDQINIREPDEAGGPAPVKTCPECQEVVMAGVRECPCCGFLFEITQTPKQFDKPNENAEFVAGLVPAIQRWDVLGVDYEVWESRTRGKPPTLRVSYYCGLARTVSEWICLEHPPGTYPRRRAEWWWSERKLPAPAPNSVDTAAVILSLDSTRQILREPQAVVVDARGKYPELKGVVYSREPGSDDGDGEPPVSPQDFVAPDDLPF